MDIENKLKAFDSFDATDKTNILLTAADVISQLREQALLLQLDNQKVRRAFSLCNFDASVFSKEDRYLNQQIVEEARKLASSPTTSLAEHDESVRADERGNYTDIVTKAIRSAWALGQTYWQQADSESSSQNKKAETTRQQFITLIDDVTKKIVSSGR